MKHTRVALAALLLTCVAPVAAAQSVLFVVRHAERADAGEKSMKGADPSLSPAGESRAQRLASILRSEHIKKIFVTEFKRTRQTAEPTAKAQRVTIETTPAKDVDALIAKLAATDGPALVVGHSDTIADILKGLGVKENVRIGDKEYDNLFVVFGPGTRKPALVKLRY